MERRPALGKGLSALIPDAPTQTAGGGILELDIDALSANSQQPRLQMNDASLDDLARSIRANGIIQPLLVRRVDDGYRIIAGERRWRAARKAGVAKVPVVVREAVTGGDKELLELALIENIQRENLNPIDEAVAYQRLIDEHALTQEEIAAAVGKDRSSVANYMRLLRLHDEVRAQVASGALTMGHARALLGSDDPEGLGRQIVQRGLSVRETERLIKKAKTPPRTRAALAGGRGGDPDLLALERQLTDMLGLKVKINHQSRSGSMTLAYSSLEQLDMICQRLSGESI